MDVKYHEQARAARAAAVVFAQWDDSASTAEYAADCDRIQPYLSGEFYRRELPALLTLLERIQEPVSTVLVDGYVNLGPKPGLGMRLWQAAGQEFAVVGVAKSRFRSRDARDAVEILRGKSRKPLYITAVGMDPHAASNNVRRMHGAARIPTLLKRVDQLTRR